MDSSALLVDLQDNQGDGSVLVPERIYGNLNSGIPQIHLLISEMILLYAIGVLCATRKGKQPHQQNVQRVTTVSKALQAVP